MFLCKKNNNLYLGFKTDWFFYAHKSYKAQTFF